MKFLICLLHLEKVIAGGARFFLIFSREVICFLQSQLSSDYWWQDPSLKGWGRQSRQAWKDQHQQTCPKRWWCRHSKSVLLFQHLFSQSCYGKGNMLSYGLDSSVTMADQVLLDNCPFCSIRTAVFWRNYWTTSSWPSWPCCWAGTPWSQRCFRITFPFGPSLL